MSTTTLVKPLELTYRQAMRAYWRAFWPSQLLATALLLAAELTPLSWVWIMLIGIVLSAAALYLFVPRIWSRPYTEFSLELGPLKAGAPRVRPHLSVWAFLWWRQFSVGLLASMLVVPVNMLLGRIGVQIHPAIATAGAILAVGPLLLKMLIDNQSAGFLLEAHRR